MRAAAAAGWSRDARPQIVFLAVILYVTLDLSLPMMPGAFVFDIEDSVESAQSHRGRPTTEVPHAAGPDSSPVPQPSVAAGDPRGRMRGPSAPRVRPMVSVLPRGTLPSPSPGEDPQ
jgi:hypothetical protein